MTTLTDFLLARIAEDEAAVDVEGTFGDPAAWSDAPLQRLDYDEMRVGPSRVLAECEAKRRIVLGLEALFNNGRCDQWEIEDALDVVYPLLALPYADHPDYREEWKP